MKFHKISRSLSSCSLLWCHSDRLEASSSSVCSPEWYSIRARVLWVMVTVQGPCAQGSPSTCIGILELFRISWYQTQQQHFKGALKSPLTTAIHIHSLAREKLSGTHKPPTTATEACVLWPNSFLLSKRNIHLNCKLQLRIWFEQLSAWDSVLCTKKI